MERTEFERIFKTPVDVRSFEQNRMSMLARMAEYRRQVIHLAEINQEPFKVNAVSKGMGYEFEDNRVFLLMIKRTSYAIYLELRQMGLKEQADKILTELS
mgnify:FL=1